MSKDEPTPVKLQDLKPGTYRDTNGKAYSVIEIDGQKAIISMELAPPDSPEVVEAKNRERQRKSANAQRRVNARNRLLKNDREHNTPKPHPRIPRFILAEEMYELGTIIQKLDDFDIRQALLGIKNRIELEDALPWREVYKAKKNRTKPNTGKPYFSG